jgi:RimJ/RimL family protein N-acetyltransferase
MQIARTERLAIRHFRRDDLDDLQDLCGDAEAMRYVGDGQPLTRAQTAEWIEVSQVNYERYGFGCFAIASVADDRLIGYCGLVRPTPDGTAEIIYGLEKRSWGRGLTSEAAAVVIDLAFGRFGLAEVIATIDPDNLPSIRIAGKLGMRFVERRTDEFGLPELLYSIRSGEHRAGAHAG